MQKQISWIGTIASIAGSFLVANGFYTIGFSCFMLGSVSWLYIATKNKDRALLTMNVTFLMANFMGLYNALV